ncbi:glycine receptor subunit alphaZ1-like [Paramuricea clavata]|nr:glycine receptor subunit alphaZ1-like [Paramuricea clavata]
MDGRTAIFGLVVAVVVCFCPGARAKINTTTSSLDPFDILTKGYNKKLRPNYSGHAVKVLASSYIVALDNVNDVKSDFTVKMYFSQYWNDSRLIFGDELQGLEHKGYLRVVGEDMKDIWTPDTYVENEENIGGHKIFSSVKITRHGEVHMSKRLTIKANCPTMNLKLFPHDVQTCDLLQTSYAFPNTELTYAWKSENAVIVGESSIATQYILDKAITSIEDVYFKSTNATWTYLKLKFVLRRKIAYYIIRIYLPAILVTLTSWISFWVDPTAIPARLSLCVITVLAMTTLSYSSQSMVPSVPYVKAVDVYLIISFFFVFGSLLEYACLLNIRLRCVGQRAHKQKGKAEEIPLTNKEQNDGIAELENGKEKGCNGKENVQESSGNAGYFSTWTLDTFSSVLFPAAYVFFHFVFYLVILA